MLMDIFSSFDPATSSMFSSTPSPIFWATNFTLLLMMLTSFWATPSRMNQLLLMPQTMMNTQASRTQGYHLKGFNTTLTSLFILMITVNLSGLMPYVFSTSSHLLFTLSYGLPMWLSLILSSFVFKPKTAIASLLPGGAPDWLNPPLVLIESSSIIVRPITLSFRLAANMSAGHIILGLIGIYTAAAIFSSPILMLTLLSMQTSYILFEVAICLIQAYVFCLLLSLYTDDHSA